jgi:hypothetical protein
VSKEKAMPWYVHDPRFQRALNDTVKEMNHGIDWECPNPPNVEAYKCFKAGVSRLHQMGCTISTSASSGDCHSVDGKDDATWHCLIKTLDCEMTKSTSQVGCKKITAFSDADKIFFKSPRIDAKDFKGICVQEIATGSNPVSGRRKGIQSEDIR